MVRNKQNDLARVSLGVYVLLLALVLLTPNLNGKGAFWGLITITGTLERALNLLLFTPMPILLSISFLQIGLVAIRTIGVLTPIAIEFIQLYIPGRVSDPVDVLTNSLGFLVSLFLWRRFIKG